MNDVRNGGANDENVAFESCPVGVPVYVRVDSHSVRWLASLPAVVK